MKKEATKIISSLNWREIEDKELRRLIKFYYSQGNNMKAEDLKKVSVVKLKHNSFDVLIDFISFGWLRKQ